MKLKEALKGVLDENALSMLIKSYDLIGDIIVIRIPPELYTSREIIAEALHKIYPRVRTIAAVPLYAQTDTLFRTRELEVVWGDESLRTTYRESGCIFKTDLKRMFLSPRLSYERMRIAKQVLPGETVINMFAGVGCYSIVIGKHSKPWKVYSIDVNPSAFQYLVENIQLNKVETLVVGLQGDSKEVIEMGLQDVADRVLMPLPELALEYLDYALLALKPVGGWIHYYGFEHAKKNEHPVHQAEKRVSNKLVKLCDNFRVDCGRVVRTVGPRWYQVVLDLKVDT